MCVSKRAVRNQRLNSKKCRQRLKSRYTRNCGGFLESVRTRRPPLVDGAAGRRALELATRVMAATLEHAQRVQLGTFAPQDSR